MQKSNYNLKDTAFGYHLSLELYNCQPEKARNIEACYNCLSEIPKIIRTDIQSPPVIVHRKGIGFAGWIPVVESGISLYIFFPTNFISIDIYTCKKFDNEKVKQFVIKSFSPKKVKDSYLLRGQDYIPPIELIKKKRGIKKIKA